MNFKDLSCIGTDLPLVLGNKIVKQKPAVPELTPVPGKPGFFENTKGQLSFVPSAEIIEPSAETLATRSYYKIRADRLEELTTTYRKARITGISNGTLARLLRDNYSVSKYEDLSSQAMCGAQHDILVLMNKFADDFGL